MAGDALLAQPAAGGVRPIILPASDVTVAEWRGETFGNVTWLLAPRWTLEAGLAAEFSQITAPDACAGQFAPLLVGDGERAVRRIAWCTGGAQGYFEAAIAAGADVFITGEISEPQAHLARECGVAFLACGHHATERYGAPALAAQVAAQLGLQHQFIEIDNPA